MSIFISSPIYFIVDHRKVSGKIFIDLGTLNMRNCVDDKKIKNKLYIYI